MKNYLLIILGATLFSLPALSQHSGHPHHAKHNMIFFGNDTLYASHLVYKSPHNYQVLLELTPQNPEVKKLYLNAKAKNPQATFIFLLDVMDIKDIKSATTISGTLFYRDENNQKIEILPNLKLNEGEFKVIFFNELPLSLEP